MTEEQLQLPHSKKVKMLAERAKNIANEIEAFTLDVFEIRPDDSISHGFLNTLSEVEGKLISVSLALHKEAKRQATFEERREANAKLTQAWKNLDEKHDLTNPAKHGHPEYPPLDD